MKRLEVGIRREGEGSWHRSERLFEKQGHWYFQTREGIAVGPYGKRFEAELAIALLVPVLHQCESGSEAISAVHGFCADPVRGPACRITGQPGASSTPVEAWAQDTREPNTREPNTRGPLTQAASGDRPRRSGRGGAIATLRGWLQRPQLAH